MGIYKPQYIKTFESPPAAALMKGRWMETGEAGWVIRCLEYRGNVYIIKSEKENGKETTLPRGEVRPQVPASEHQKAVCPDAWLGVR